MFTHARPDEQPDSWLKVDVDAYRRTYSWVRFSAKDFASWTHVELTKPVDYSITQEEADAMEKRVRDEPGPREIRGLQISLPVTAPGLTSP